METLHSGQARPASQGLEILLLIEPFLELKDCGFEWSENSRLVSHMANFRIMNVNLQVLLDWF